MAKKQWYELLFHNYGESYDNEPFVHGTLAECDFIEKEIDYNKSVMILDVGCGTGRHSIELAKRGYSLTGIDLSESLLTKAKEKAGKQNVVVDFQIQDARSLPFDNEFDLAIMICEGAFPLMETDEMNFEILKNIEKALKPGSKLIFTTLNGLFPIYHSINDFHESDKNDAGAVYKSETFDLMTFRDYNITGYTDDEGKQHSIECNERYYLPSEISWLLKSLGFTNIDIFGAKLGAFSRNDKLNTEDYEMLVIAVKP